MILLKLSKLSYPNRSRVSRVVSIMSFNVLIRSI
nr:MAG TPA: hypothetical protein [Caudoviricetes sp.]